MTPSLPSQQSAHLFDSEYSSSDGPDRNQKLTWVVVALAVVGLLISGYLTWTTWSSEGVAGCSTGGAVDCEQVLKSHWSKWLGIPVSLLGLATYVGILVSSLMLTRDRQGIAATALLAFALLAAGSATWFIGLQVFQLGSFCLYCMAVHLCSLTICGLTVAMLQMGGSPSGNEHMGAMFGVNAPAENYYEPEASMSQVRPLIASGVAAVGITILMMGQFFVRPAGLKYETVEKPVAETDVSASVEQTSATDAPTLQDSDSIVLDDQSSELPVNDDSSATDPALTDEQPEEETSSKPIEQRLISFGNLAEPIDVANAPILGSPDAEHVLLEMLDYTCPHCRRLHPHVEASLERYGNQVAFVVFHVPLSKKCNPYIKRDHWSHKHACDYAQLALSVFRLDRSKFAEFHHFVMDSKRPPIVAEARRIAMNLVGEEVLLDQNLKAESLSSFAGNSDDMKKMNSGLPLILTTGGKLEGVPNSEAEWFKFLESTLGVVPVKE